MIHYFLREDNFSQLEKIKPYFLPVLLIIVLTNIISPSVSAELDDDIETLINKGQNAVKSERFDEVIFYFDKVLQIEPDNINALNNKGAALIKLGKFDEAIFYFDKVLQIEPNNINALNNKGAALGHSGKYIEAISELDKVLQIEPDNINALNNKDSAFTELKKKYIIYGQFQVRNSDGHLITYMELDKVGILDPFFLEKQISTLTPEKTITINGKNYIVFKIANISENKKYYTVISASGFGYTAGYYFFQSFHDGYLVTIGDTVTFEWTILQSES